MYIRYVREETSLRIENLSEVFRFKKKQECLKLSILCLALLVMLLPEIFSNILESYFGEGNGNPFQYSCLENAVDRGAWWAAVHRVAQSRTRLKRLSSSSSRIIFSLKRRAFSLMLLWLFTQKLKHIREEQFPSPFFIPVQQRTCHVFLRLKIFSLMSTATM